MSLSCKKPKAFPIFRKFLGLACFSKAYFIHSRLQRTRKIKALLGAAYWHRYWNIITLCGAAVMGSSAVCPQVPNKLRIEGGGFVLSFPFKDAVCNWMRQMKAKGIGHEFWRPDSQEKDKSRSSYKHMSILLPSLLDNWLVEATPTQNLLFFFDCVPSCFPFCYTWAFPLLPSTALGKLRVRNATCSTCGFITAKRMKSELHFARDEPRWDSGSL